jgi:hypothetical protein
MTNLAKNKRGGRKNMTNTNTIHKNILQIESQRTRGGKGLHSRSNLWFLHKSPICGPLSQETIRGRETREGRKGKWKR